MLPKAFSLLAFCWLIALNCNAQQIYVQGTVIDAQTNKPVVAATIGIANINLFFPADDQGRFSINDSRIQATDTISISCVGYITKQVLATDMAHIQAVKLEPYITKLNEVRIGYQPPQLTKVGSKVKSYFAVTSFAPGMEAAMFMQGSAHVKGIIQTVEFYLKQGNLFFDGGDVTAPFRIKIYDVGPDGKPGRELVSDVIIVSGQKKNKWCKIDVSRYQVANPENGFFVAFVLLDKNFYQLNDKYRGSIYRGDTYRAPQLSFTEHEFNEMLSYQGNGHGYWHPESKINYMIRATVAAN